MKGGGKFPSWRVRSGFMVKDWRGRHPAGCYFFRGDWGRGGDSL